MAGGVVFEAKRIVSFKSKSALYFSKINKTSNDPIYVQIVRQIRGAICAKRLRGGDQIPPVRVLAAHLLVNPNTVARAYNELSQLGFLETRIGRGVFVSKRRPNLSRFEKIHRLKEATDVFINQIADLGLPSIKIIKCLEKELESSKR